MKHLYSFLLTALLWCPMAESGAQTSGSFVYDGVNRSYIVYVPASFVPGMPLVFVLHGFTQSAQTIMNVSGFNEVADTGNFIVAYPNGIGNAWNTNSGMSGGSTADDIGFIAALTDTLSARYSIDTTRVYSCGFSAGGYMSHRLACESLRCYAAIASVAGTMSTAAYSDCNPSRQTSVLQIHGTADAVVSYNGGFGGVSVDDVIARWNVINSCPAAPVVTTLPDVDPLDNSTVESSLYSPCASTTELCLLKVIGGGHQWPGTNSVLGGLGAINRDIHASAVIWNFFRSKSCNTVSSGVPDPALASIRVLSEGPARYVFNSTAQVSFSYVLADQQGRLLASGKLVSGDVIDLSALASGIYFLRLAGEKQSDSFRLWR